jgi:Flp pilus assembly protein TadG
MKTHARFSIQSSSRRGATLVETALVLPLCLLLILGVFEYSRYLMLVHLCTNAAREGCRYASSHTESVTVGGTTEGNATSDVTNRVTAFLAGQSLASQSVQVYESDSLGNNIGTWTNAAAGQFVCVKITGNFQSAIPNFLLMPSSLPIKSQAVMACEGN